MQSSQSVGAASSGQQAQPRSGPEGHAGMRPMPPPPPPPVEPDNRSSDDESNASDEQEWSKWPESRADDQAQWRQNALAKRAELRKSAARCETSLKTELDSQVSSDAGKLLHGSEGCNDSLVAASAANETPDPPKPSGMIYAFVVQIERENETVTLSNEHRSKEISQESNTIFSPRLSSADQAGERYDRTLNELRPTMSESLNAITERFLNIDVLDKKQDLSRFMAYLLDTIELLSGRVAFLEAKEDHHDPHATSEIQAPRLTGSQEEILVGKVLHKIHCGKLSHAHDDSYYEDKPTFKDRQSKNEAKLTGEKFVHNLDDYLDLHPNICFLVVNEHVCTNYFHPFGGPPGGMDHRQKPGSSIEKLRIIAPLLQRALLQVAEYHPVPSGIFGGDMDFLRTHGMFAPYPFLFHHHKKLVQLSLDEKYTGALRPLLEFLDSNYGKDYEEANSLFEKGFTTAHHLSKLFKPSQMVVGRQESGILEAHVLSWCHARVRDTIALSGWSWLYDGNELRRSPWAQTIEGVPDERMRIADLKVHPVDFARTEDIRHLETRGGKFWSMRDQTYICYTGWDKARQYHYVRAALIPLPFNTLNLNQVSKYIAGWREIHGRCVNI